MENIAWCDDETFLRANKVSEIIIISSYDFLLGWRLLPRGLDTKWPLVEKGLIRQEAKKKERKKEGKNHASLGSV